MSTRGFFGRRPDADTAKRLPPGQYQTQDFPVLSKGATPRVAPADWRFTLYDGPRPLASWSWDEFQALPRTKWHGDIHCVTKWSKFDTDWEGVTVDDLLAAAGIAAPTPWVLALSYDDYDTNVPLA
ncbi:MAG: sulfite oxidase-like oxidoreductase, partial [Aquabacterium sp.]